MTPHIRSKEQPRKAALTDRGNALVFETVLGRWLGRLAHPNRIMRVFRSSSRRRYAA